MDDARAFRALEQLRALLGRPGVTARRRDLGDRVIERLSRPVRVVVVGRGTAFQRDLLAGFVGDAPLPDMPDLPPVRLVFGRGWRLSATFASGDVATLAPGDLARTDPRALALLEVTAPIPILEKTTLLHVALEGDAEDCRRATAWAAGQADILVWAAEAPGADDAALWVGLPDAVRDHAFLACAADPAALPAAAAETFLRCCRVSGTAGAAQLRAEVLAHVSAARREDIERALMLLDEDPCAPLAPDAPRTEPAAPAPPAPLALPGDDAGPRAGDIVRLLAARAEALAAADRRVDGGVDGGRDARALLELASETLEDCAALAEGSCAEDIVAEACEVMLLLGLEATPAARTDALALLVQVRRECAALVA